MTSEKSLISNAAKNLTLSPKVTKGLETWEDHISFYLQLTEASNAFSWKKADVLRHLVKKFGNKSMENVANDIGEPRSTVVNYVRVAKAFPPDKRDPYISFSHHFQASFADSYDESTGKFQGEDRFEWTKKAGDENMSTRKLRQEIQDTKEKEQLEEGEVFTCDFCEKPNNLSKFVFYEFGSGKDGNQYRLHQPCYGRIIDFIVSGGKK